MVDGCYDLIAVPLTWLEAEAEAARRNATLVSIHSASANNWFVEQLRRLGWYTADFWMGLNDIQQESMWRQSDKSAFDYDKFAAGQANKPNYQQNCAYFSTSDTYWYDGDCSVSKFALIKYNPGVQPAKTGEKLCVRW